MKVDLPQIASELPVDSFSNYRDYLKQIYLSMKERNESYSYNQFSQDLGLGWSNVSWLIVTGRRRITNNTLKKIVPSLQLHRMERRYFSYLVKYNNAKNNTEKERFFKLLLATKNKMNIPDVAKSELAYLSHWYHPVIREMCGMKDFYSETKWIISKFYTKLLPREVKESLSLLESLGLIKYSRNKGRHVLTERQIGPREEVVHLGIEGYHKKMLEIASDSLSKVPPERRDYNALSVSVSSQDVEKLRELIHNFCRDVMALEDEVKDPDQVFQINVHMFPFTRD